MAGSFIDDPWLAQCFQDSNAQFVPPEQPLINDVRIRRRIRTHPSAIVLPKGSGRTFEADGDGDYVIPALQGETIIVSTVIRLMVDAYPRLTSGAFVDIKNHVLSVETLAELCRLYDMNDKVNANEQDKARLKANHIVQADLFKAYVWAINLQSASDCTLFVETIFNQILSSEHKYWKDRYLWDKAIDDEDIDEGGEGSSSATSSSVSNVHTVSNVQPTTPSEPAVYGPPRPPPMTAPAPKAAPARAEVSASNATATPSATVAGPSLSINIGDGFNYIGVLNTAKQQGRHGIQDYVFEDTATGPSHQPSFTAKCIVNGVVRGTAEAPTKKLARNRAAGQAVIALGVPTF